MSGIRYQNVSKNFGEVEVIKSLDLEIADGEDWLDNLNSTSLKVLPNCYLESSLEEARPGQRFQFERLGYFSVDPDSACGKPVFNRTVTLRDQWARIAGGKQDGK